MDVRISASRLTRFFLIVLGVLFVGSVCVQVIAYGTGHRRLMGLYNLLNMDGEQSLPTWFNSFLLAFLCVVARVISHNQSPDTLRYRGYWEFLSFVFLVMSIDEITAIHEMIGELVTTRFHTAGYLYFGFVIPGTLLALALFMVYLPFLKSLPRKTALGLVAGGAIYVAGAAGMESISANWYFLHADKKFILLCLADIEEFLEMLGLILFLNGLLSHLRFLPANPDEPA